MSELWVHTIPLVISLAAALLLTPLVRRLAVNKGWIDHPGGWRKIHRSAVPNTGGVAIVAAFYLGVLSLYIVGILFPALSSNLIYIPPVQVLAGGLLIASAGFYDDLKGLSAIHKFTIQILVSAAVVWGSYVVALFVGSGFRYKCSDHILQDMRRFEPGAGAAEPASAGSWRSR